MNTGEAIHLEPYARPLVTEIVKRVRQCRSWGITSYDVIVLPSLPGAAALADVKTVTTMNRLFAEKVGELLRGAGATVSINVAPPEPEELESRGGLLSPRKTWRRSQTLRSPRIQVIKDKPQRFGLHITVPATAEDARRVDDFVRAEVKRVTADIQKHLKLCYGVQPPVSNDVLIYPISLPRLQGMDLTSDMTVRDYYKDMPALIPAFDAHKTEVAPHTEHLYGQIMNRLTAQLFSMVQQYPDLYFRLRTIGERESRDLSRNVRLNCGRDWVHLPFYDSALVLETTTGKVGSTGGWCR